MLIPLAISEYKLEIQKKDKVREFMFPDASDSTKLGLSGDAGEVRVVPVIVDVLGNVSITSGQ